MLPKPAIVSAALKTATSYVLNAVEVLRFGGLQTDEESSPFEIVARRPMFRLRRYYPPAEEDAGRGGVRVDDDEAPRPPIVLVPPMMISADVWDVSPSTSAVAALHAAGMDPWVIDFGAPDLEAGGLERASWSASRRRRGSRIRQSHCSWGPGCPADCGGGSWTATRALGSSSSTPEPSPMWCWPTSRPPSRVRAAAHCPGPPRCGSSRSIPTPARSCPGPMGSPYQARSTRRASSSPVPGSAWMPPCGNSAGCSVPADTWVSTNDLFERDRDGDFWFLGSASSVVHTPHGPVYPEFHNF